jgi:transposase
MIGAIGLDGFKGFMSVDAATDRDVFMAFVEQELAPNLRQGDCVVMDNLGTHKMTCVQQVIEARGATIFFLPPYSPDFNPIEKLWGKLKEFLRRQITTTRDLFDEALAEAMKTITIEDIMGWTKHAGYSISEI